MLDEGCIYRGLIQRFRDLWYNMVQSSCFEWISQNVTKVHFYTVKCVKQGL